MAPLNEGALVDDLLRLDELAETFIKSGTPEQRKLLREFLELQADRSSQDILENGAKLPASFKDVFPTMYHYADDGIIGALYKDEAGKLRLRARPNGENTYFTNFLAEDSVDVDQLLQLKPGAHRRYRIEVTTDQFDELRIPAANNYSAQEGWVPQKWLEPLIKDNPQFGSNPKGSQFVASGQDLRVQVFDRDTGQELTADFLDL